MHCIKKLLYCTFVVLAVFMLVSCSIGVKNTQASESAKPSSSAEISEAQTSQKPSESTETATAKPTESVDSAEETPEASANASTVKPSDDLFAYEAVVNGKLIKFPTTAPDMYAIGYTLGNDADDTLEGGYMTGSLMTGDDGGRIGVSLYNDSKDPLPLKECSIDGGNIDQMVNKENKVLFAKGIVYGSTTDEVLAAFGEPARISNGDTESPAYIYAENPENLYNNCVTFTFFEGALSGVSFAGE